MKIDGASIPDSKMAREATELVRDIATPLLFNHSSRVYCFASIAGKRQGVLFDSELLYIASMFHDLGLTARYNSPSDRFEVDGANAARDFLRQHGIDPCQVDTVWAAIALHTTPGIPQYMHPVIALTSAGVLMDVVGGGFQEFTAAQRNSVVRAFPREESFEEDIIQTFYDWNKHKPHSTYATINADILAEKDPSFQRVNACSRIRHSPWKH
jgi:hypothetical protein